jgi:hypothetical protein
MESAMQNPTLGLIVTGAPTEPSGAIENRPNSASG